MPTIRRVCAMLLPALTAALVLAGCGDDDASSASSNGGSDGGGERVGLVLKTLANPVWQGVEQGAKAEAEKRGVELEVEAGKTEADIQGQINAVENMLVKGVDAIAISPNGTGQLMPALQKAVDEGVPVVLIDTDVPNFDDKTALVVTDNKGVSRQLSERFVEELGGKAVAGVLTFPQVSPVELRVEGTKEAIAGTDVQIVSELTGDCLRNKAVNATTDMLQAHPDIDAIFGSCGQNAVGAIQAAKLAGRKPGEDIKIVGFDGVPQELDAIQAGEQFATVFQDFPGIGAQAIAAALDAKAGKEVPKELFVDAAIVTKENVGEYLGK